MKSKVCTKCKEEKPISEFFKRREGTGVRHACKKCEYAQSLIWRKANPDKQSKINRRKKLQYKYNLTESELNQMKISQNNRCYICEREVKLVIDHCHTTGKVRKLLCYNCNTLLGHIENKAKMAIVKKYLNDHKEDTNAEEAEV